MELTPKQLEELYAERTRIEAWMKPTPEEIQRAQWKKEASKRINKIDEKLAAHFFPEPKDEGTQRVSEDGFKAMLKTGLKRVFDAPTIKDVMALCPEGTESDCIEYKPTLKLTQYRNLTDDVRKQFECCLVITEENPIFEIVKDN